MWINVGEVIAQNLTDNFDAKHSDSMQIDFNHTSITSLLWGRMKIANTCLICLNLCVFSAAGYGHEIDNNGNAQSLSQYSEQLKATFMVSPVVGKTLVDIAHNCKKSLSDVDGIWITEILGVEPNKTYYMQLVALSDQKPSATNTGNEVSDVLAKIQCPAN
jgi:hypothetical protein